MKEKFTRFLVLLMLSALWVLILPLNVSLYAADDVPFEMITTEDAIDLTESQSTVALDLLISVPEGHYIYADKTVLLDVSDSKGALQFTGVEWPVSVAKDDPFSGGIVQIFEAGEVRARIQFKVLDHAKLPTVVSGRVSIQGCSETLCFRPVMRTFSEDIRLASSARVSEDATKNAGEKSAQKITQTTPSLSHIDRLHKALAHNVLLGLLLAFIGGILTDFTPCVLPVIPLILLFIGVRRDGPWQRNLPPVISLILGMTLSYVVLGVLAVYFGLNLGFIFQNIYFLFGLSIFFALMALILLDILPFQLPSKIQTRLSTVGGKTLKGSFAVGMTMGLIALPCVGPVMGAILLYVASTRDFALGVGYMIAYALGMGSVFIGIALVFEKARRFFERPWLMRAIKPVFAAFFIALSLYYGYVFFQVRGDSSAASTSEDGIWATSFEEGRAIARSLRRPMLLDFRADWCLPCLEMEKTTFVDPRVLQAFEEKIVPIRIDCTRASDACDALTDRFNIVGFPTLIFLNPDESLRHAPLQGYVSRDALLEAIDVSEQASKQIQEQKSDEGDSLK